MRSHHMRITALLLLALLILGGCQIATHPVTDPIGDHTLPRETQQSPIAPVDPPTSGGETTAPLDSDPTVTDPAVTDPAETDPIVTDPVETDPTVTDPIVTDPPETDPPETDPPKPELPPLQGDEILLTPQNGEVTLTLKSQTGTRLNLVAEGTGEKRNDGSYDLRIKLELEHTSIQCRDRKGCFLRIGSERVEFSMPAMEQSEIRLSRTSLASLRVNVKACEIIEIEASLPFHGTYGGVEVDVLTISEKIVLLP